MKSINVATSVLRISFLYFLIFNTASCVGQTASWTILSQSEGLHAVGYSDIVFFDKEVGLVSTMGQIRKSSNGGQSWRTVLEIEKSNISALSVRDNRIWAVGSDERSPAVFYSDDRGESWNKSKFIFSGKEISTEKSTLLYSLSFADSGRVWFAGNSGIIEGMVSGNNFEVRSVFHTDEPIYSITVVDDRSNEVIAVGGRGGFYKFRDKWETSSIKEANSLYSVKSVGADIWVTGSSKSGGILLKSKDGGEHWDSKTPVLAPTLFDVVISGRLGWLVGSGGTTYFSRDTGESWELVKSPTRNDLQKVFYLDSKNVWTTGDKATVMKLNYTK